MSRGENGRPVEYLCRFSIKGSGLIIQEETVIRKNVVNGTASYWEGEGLYAPELDQEAYDAVLQENMDHAEGGTS